MSIMLAVLVLIWQAVICKTISYLELLGHEDIWPRLNIYSYVATEIKRRATDKLDTLFKKNSSL